MTGAKPRGGRPGRRAVLRWSWRLFRRDWRQQVTVLALMTVAVAASVGFATTSYNLAPASGNAEFGTADHFLRIENPDPARLSATLDAARNTFGQTDVITHRKVPIPGVVDTLDYRSQQPGGPFAGPLLDLRSGRFPLTTGETAVTDGTARMLSVSVGATLSLDGTPRSVVGIVENPTDLDDEFALITAGDIAPDSVTVLVQASEDQIRAFRPAGAGITTVGARSDIREDVVAAVISLIVAAVGLGFVGLIATSSFLVLAQRRRRQLGMLGAIGATEKQVRLVTLAGGALTGSVAALIGVALGVAGWVALVPWMERTTAHRIDAYAVPWWVAVSGALLAVGSSTAASWWPARTMARVAPIVAVSGRRSPPARVHRSVTLAVALAGGGIACLVLAGGLTDETTVHLRTVVLMCVGTVAVVVGVLLLSPLAVRGLAAAARPAPIAVRLALRDIGRYQARSGAALAAITLALGIPLAIVIAAAAAAPTGETGNLSDHQLIIRTANTDGPFIPPAADLPRLQTGADNIVASLGKATVIPLDVALDPAAEVPPDIQGRQALALALRVADGWRDLSLLYVATPELLRLYDVDASVLGAESRVISVERGELGVFGEARRSDRPKGRALPETVRLEGTFTSLPGTFVTHSEVQAQGWERTASGQWLVQTEQPITADQRARAREAAAAAGLTIETRDTKQGLAKLRSGATAIGMLTAVAILTLTVGLIRGEAAGELRTLTAAGASSFTRRTLTAATAGGLAALGVALGTIGAYVVLAAGPFTDADGLARAPYANLAALILGTPIAAVIAGWLTAGREPSQIARRPLE